MLTNRIALAGATCCLLASSCMVSDPELSDLAISSSGSAIYIAVALCPGEKFSHGSAAWEGGGAELVPAGNHGRTARVKLALAKNFPPERIRGRLDVELNLVDVRGRERLIGSFWTRSEVLSATDRYLSDDLTTVEPAELVARGC